VTVEIWSCSGRGCGEEREARGEESGAGEAAVVGVAGARRKDGASSRERKIKGRKRDLVASVAWFDSFR
jgi:hypothetical protein